MILNVRFGHLFSLEYNLANDNHCVKQTILEFLKHGLQFHHKDSIVQSDKSKTMINRGKNNKHHYQVTQLHLSKPYH